jgi:hypothetical protein
MFLRSARERVRRAAGLLVSDAGDEHHGRLNLTYTSIAVVYGAAEAVDVFNVVATGDGETFSREKLSA